MGRESVRVIYLGRFGDEGAGGKKWEGWEVGKGTVKRKRRWVGEK